MRPHAWLRRGLACLLCVALGGGVRASALEPAVLVRDIRPGDGGSSPTDLTAVGGRVLFVAADSDARGRELWRSDGTAEGTALVGEVNPEPFRDGEIAALTVFHGLLHFAAGRPFAFGGLWQSDGSAAGTRRVNELLSSAGGLTVAGERLFFFSSAGVGSLLCWYDGAQIACGEQGFRLFGARLVAVGGRVFFAAAEGDDSVDTELWLSDGSAAGTRRVRDLRPGPQGSGPGWLTAVGERLAFVAADGVRGRLVWSSDGSEAGTRLLSDAATEPGDLVAAGARLFFAADAREGGRALWVADAGLAEARQVRRFAGGVYPVAPFGDAVLLVVGRGGDNGGELWRSDGTAAGTQRLRAFRAGQGSLPAYGFVDLGGRTVFTGCGADGCEPWLTDGTPAGTRQLADVWPGAASSYASGYARLRGRLMFSAATELGHELWAIDLGAPCAGDCDGDGETSVAELTAAVAVALGAQPPSACAAADADGDGAVQIAELVAAVDAALAGCGG